jgi:hypothetical protein
VTFGGLAALAAFLLLAPPVYFLGPLLVLLVLSRPRTVLEFVVILAALVGSAGVLAREVELGIALVKASAMGVALAFGIMSIRGGATVLTRGVLSLGVTGVALSGWAFWRGITWEGVQTSFRTLLTEAYRQLPQLSTDPDTQQRIREMIAPQLDLVPAAARVMPGILALVALGGMALAALWQHRIARHPIGRAPAPFRAFRFNDHLIWGAIFSLALMLAPLPPAGQALAANLLVIWVGLYVMRGIAVVSAFLAAAPLLFKLVVAILAVVVNFLALGACLAVGLADTWLDIRRRLVPPAPEGVS